jgi:hypothetical protein
MGNLMDVELDENGQPLKQGELKQIPSEENLKKEIEIFEKLQVLRAKLTGTSSNKPFHMIGVGNLKFIQVYQYQMEESMKF